MRLLANPTALCALPPKHLARLRPVSQPPRCTLLPLQLTRTHVVRKLKLGFGKSCVLTMFLTLISWTPSYTCAPSQLQNLTVDVLSGLPVHCSLVQHNHGVSRISSILFQFDHRRRYQSTSQQRAVKSSTSPQASPLGPFDETKPTCVRFADRCQPHYQQAKDKHERTPTSKQDVTYRRNTSNPRRSPSANTT